MDMMKGGTPDQVYPDPDEVPPRSMRVQDSGGPLSSALQVHPSPPVNIDPDKVPKASMRVQDSGAR